jgi:alkanesulfonate monooxygenase SsuD/methylene tetrahydromethanopterin reductase-like flavin-dependent oxidoreductase (luciferase family)
LKIGLLYDLRNPARSDWFVPWDRYYHGALDHIEAMDQAGFDVIAFAEHHGDPDGYNPAITLAMTAAAMRTSQARIATNILQLPYYHPMMLAEQLAMVDILSGGRLQVAFGAGGMPFDMEFRMLGVNPKQRPSRLEEGLEVVLRCWTEDRPFDFNGKRWQLEGAWINPKPLQQPHPPVYLTAARAQQAMDRVARLGMNVCGAGGTMYGLTDEPWWNEWTAQWRATCERFGRDPDSLKVSSFGTGFVTDDPERAWARHREGALHHVNYERQGIRPYSSFILKDRKLDVPEDLPGWRRLFLTPEEAIAELRACFARHAPDELLLQVARPGMSWDESAEYHEAFMTKVVPHIQDLGQQTGRTREEEVSAA